MISFPLFLYLSCFSKSEDHEDTSLIDTSVDTQTNIEPDVEASEPEETGDTQSPQGPPFVVLGNTPFYGPTTGGTIVHITGEDFPSDIEIFFGTHTAVVIEVTEEQIIVESPAVPDEGLFDIQIRSEGATVSHNESFRYYEESTGQTGLFGSFAFEETVGGYWPTQTINFDAKLLFIRPQDIHWWQLSTNNFDSCTHSTEPPNSSVYPLDFSAPFLELIHEMNTISLDWDSFHLFYEENDNQEPPLNSESYALRFTEGEIKGTVLPQFLYTSHTPNLFEPILEQNTPPPITADQSFSWLPSGATWVSIHLAKVDPQTGNYVEQIRCIVEDDGNFQIAPDIWNDWAPEEQIDIYVSRSVETISILPHNLSEARIVGTHTLIGAGISQ